ncbi:MAG: winged helix-turn-helix transcriptional regulator [Rubrivivax sp.]|nr:winged helix-turn-helix transcriptional regulator [Rubrivivax sp.]
MSPPRGCTNLKLRQLSRLVTRHYERHFAETGLRITQYSLLSHVVSLAPIRAGDLAAAMRLSPSALSRNLQPLVARQLVEMAPGEDARSRIVEATVAGHAVRASAQRDWKRAQLALNERLGVERVAALHDLIDACVAELDDGSDDDGADA